MTSPNSMPNDNSPETGDVDFGAISDAAQQLMNNARPNEPTPSPEPQPEPTPPVPPILPLPARPEDGARPSNEITAPVEKTSGVEAGTPKSGEGFSVKASAAYTVSTRPSRTEQGAKDAWGNRPDGDDGQKSARVDGLSESKYIPRLRKPRSTAKVGEHSSYLLHTQGKVGSGNILEQIEPSLQSLDTTAEDPSKRISEVVKRVRNTKHEDAKKSQVDGSLVALTVGKDKVSAIVIGNCELLGGKTGGERVVSISPQQGNERGRLTNSLFGVLKDDSGFLSEGMTDDSIVPIVSKAPMRFIGASSGLRLSELKALYPQDFKNAFALEDPDECAKALIDLSISTGLANQMDHSIFVTDVEPEQVPAPAPATPPAPAQPPQPPQPPVIPPAVPVPAPVLPNGNHNRVLDATALPTVVLLQELADSKGIDIHSDEFLASGDILNEIERAYNIARTEFVEAVATMSDATIAGKKKQLAVAEKNLQLALDARQQYGAMRLDDELVAFDSTMSEAERDVKIREQITASMLGGDYTSPVDPLSTVVLKGVISEIADEVYATRMERAGWVRQFDGSFTSPESGLAKYTTRFVEKWAEWGDQGKKGMVKRVGTMAAAGAVVSAAGILGAGAASATALAVGAASTRVGRALIGTKLNKKTQLVSTARDLQDERALEIKDVYRNEEPAIDLVTNEFSAYAYDDRRQNRTRAAIGMLAAGGSATLSEFVLRPVLESASEYMSSWFGGHASAQAPQGLGKPSAAPSHTPSAPTSHAPSASSSSSASASPEASHTPSASTKPSATPSAKPSTGSNGQTGGHDSAGNGQTGNGNHHNSGEHAGNSKGVELKITDNNQTVSDVLYNAKGANFSENWNTMLSSADAAQHAGQLRVVHLQNGNFYYQSLINGHWSDNTTDVVKTLSKFSKGKFILGA